MRATPTTEDKPRGHVSVPFEVAVQPRAVGATAQLESGGRRIAVPVRRSVRAVGRGEARVSADGSLLTPTGKPAIGRAEVALAPQIDNRFSFCLPRRAYRERPLAAAPVKWRRRVFDGGLQPLHCAERIVATRLVAAGSHEAVTVTKRALIRRGRLPPRCG